MLPILIPHDLYPFPGSCVPSRPWWRIVGTNKAGVRYQRTTGEDIVLGTRTSLPDIVQALARKDLDLGSLASPPPIVGQVWAWFDDVSLVVRTILAVKIDITPPTEDTPPHYAVQAVLWSEGSFDQNAWPPLGAQLVGGPLSPWSPDAVSMLSP